MQEGFSSTKTSFFSRLSAFVRADRAAIHQGSVHSLPLQNSMIDACFHVDSFYFWPSLPSCLEEIFRVLKPGGRVVTVFSPSRLSRYSKLGWLRYARADPLAYAMALESVGFTDVEWTKGRFHCIKARKPPLRLLTEAKVEE